MPKTSQIEYEETVEGEEMPRSTWERKLIDKPQQAETSPRVRSLCHRRAQIFSPISLMAKFKV